MNPHPTNEAAKLNGKTRVSNEYRKVVYEKVAKAMHDNPMITSRELCKMIGHSNLIVNNAYMKVRRESTLK